jgi:hypothetical protein
MVPHVEESPIFTYDLATERRCAARKPIAMSPTRLTTGCWPTPLQLIPVLKGLLRHLGNCSMA